MPKAYIYLEYNKERSSFAWDNRYTCTGKEKIYKSIKQFIKSSDEYDIYKDIYYYERPDKYKTVKCLYEFDLNGIDYKLTDHMILKNLKRVDITKHLVKYSDLRDYKTQDIYGNHSPAITIQKIFNILIKVDLDEIYEYMEMYLKKDNPELLVIEAYIPNIPIDKLPLLFKFKLKNSEYVNYFTDILKEENSEYLTTEFINDIFKFLTTDKHSVRYKKQILEFCERCKDPLINGTLNSVTVNDLICRYPYLLNIKEVRETYGQEKIDNLAKEHKCEYMFQWQHYNCNGDHNALKYASDNLEITRELLRDYKCIDEILDRVTPDRCTDQMISVILTSRKVYTKGHKTYDINEHNFSSIMKLKERGVNFNTPSYYKFLLNSDLHIVKYYLFKLNLVNLKDIPAKYVSKLDDKYSNLITVTLLNDRVEMLERIVTSMTNNTLDKIVDRLI